MGVRGRNWDAEVVVKALELARKGHRDHAIHALTGVPAHTVRNWRRGRVPAAARLVLDGVPLCPDCGCRAHAFEELPWPEYAQLLGLYLGDGCLARTKSGYQLRITMDSRYPQIINEAKDSARACVGGRHVGVCPVRGQGCVNVTSNGAFWACLLPQHGPGKKHLRPIVLRPWQERIVRAEPGRFLRGLIHSDGWRGENKVHVKGRDYAYPRYQFSSRSDDIRRLFTDACDLLGVEWRPWGRWHISVARKGSVELLDAHVGPKA